MRAKAGLADEERARKARETPPRSSPKFESLIAAKTKRMTAAIRSKGAQTEVHRVSFQGWHGSYARAVSAASAVLSQVKRGLRMW